MGSKVTAPVKGRKRLFGAAGFAAAVSSVAMLGAAVTFGFFSATTGASANSISAGTVTLSSSVSGTCSATAVLPGYSNSGNPCSLQASYSGSVPGYLGVDVLIATKKGSQNGALPLYNPTDSANDLQITISDGNATYVSPSTTLNSVACSGTYLSYTACYQLTDLLVSTTAFHSGGTDTISTTLTLPSTNGSGGKSTAYQGGSAVVVVSVHAVQSGNNGSTSGCTAGQTCSGIRSWS